MDIKQLRYFMAIVEEGKNHFGCQTPAYGPTAAKPSTGHHGTGIRRCVVSSQGSSYGLDGRWQAIIFKSERHCYEYGKKC